MRSAADGDHSEPRGDEGRGAEGHDTEGGAPHAIFFAPPPWPSRGGEIALDESESQHASRAIRVRPGDRVRVVDGEGRAGSGEVTSIARRGVRVRLLEARDEETEEACAWELALPWLRSPARIDWAIEKATELGCRALHIYSAERCVTAGALPSETRLERWRAVARAAMKQSGRSYCPRVAHRGSLTALLSGWDERPRLLIGDARGGDFARLDPFRADERLLLLVGPEGGWTSEERATLARAGVERVRLGAFRLRSESAAIALAALVAARLAAMDARTG
ncbi:MAG: 16S rRNA (uracil(1498)-N(3))-methyltransferase [Candidatus Eisenbacteria bacterium]|nr:16S rRNA (uracil(1498)-N(3))-methyltransferase [Candidatus Eisenbacteria bacterium]